MRPPCINNFFRSIEMYLVNVYSQLIIVCDHQQCHSIFVRCFTQDVICFWQGFFICFISIHSAKRADVLPLSRSSYKMVIIKLYKRKDAEKIGAVKNKLRSLKFELISINNITLISKKRFWGHYKKLWAKFKRLQVNNFIHSFFLQFLLNKNQVV